MKKVDFGSGYNPAKGFLPCDITGSSTLCYHFDIHQHKLFEYTKKHFIPNHKNYAMTLCKDESINIFLMKNVIHHIYSLEDTFKELHRVLSKNGKLRIIEAIEPYYGINKILDNLWYRGINKRSDIWFSSEYRDYKRILKEIFGEENIHICKYDQYRELVTVSKK